MTIIINDAQQQCGPSPLLSQGKLGHRPICRQIPNIYLNKFDDFNLHMLREGQHQNGITILMPYGPLS